MGALCFCILCWLSQAFPILEMSLAILMMTMVLDPDNLHNWILRTLHVVLGFLVAHSLLCGGLLSLVVTQWQVIFLPVFLLSCLNGPSG